MEQIRSPTSNGSDHAFYVNPSGVVVFTNRVYYSSYGSPGTNNFGSSIYIRSSGSCANTGYNSTGKYSYGHTFILRSPAIDTEADSIFYIATDGGAYISDYISTYSYGYKMLRSPITDWYGGAYYVYESGDVYDYSGGSYYVTDSYGSTLRARIIQEAHGVF